MTIDFDLSFALNWTASCLCFFFGIKLGRVMLRRGATANDLFKGKEWQALVAIALYIGLLLIAVNLPQLQTFPLEWRFYGMRITWGIIRSLLCVTVGIAIIISWRTARVQMGMIALVGLMGFLGFLAVESHFLSPIYPQLHNNLRPNRVVKQTSASSCAPSALATVLQRWGISEATESAVAKVAGTSRMGTTMPQVLQAAKDFGLTGMELKPTWEQLEQVNRPGVLAVWQITETGEKLPHAVALMAIDPRKVILADPATGKYHAFTREEFKSIWRQEYVPIYRSSELVFSNMTALHYLQKLGYFGSLGDAVRSFQEAQGLKVNGQLDSQTALFLSGQFLKDRPTLKMKEFEAATVKYMKCENTPEKCPW
jgi:predicted double-glycine peptidase